MNDRGSDCLRLVLIITFRIPTSRCPYSLVNPMRRLLAQCEKDSSRLTHLWPKPDNTFSLRLTDSRNAGTFSGLMKSTNSVKDSHGYKYSSYLPIEMSILMTASFAPPRTHTCKVPKTVGQFLIHRARTMKRSTESDSHQYKIHGIRSDSERTIAKHIQPCYGEINSKYPRLSYICFQLVILTQ